MVVTSGSQTQQRPLVEEGDTKNNLPVPVEKEKKRVSYKYSTQFYSQVILLLY